MKLNSIVMAALVLSSSLAMADYSLSQNRKKVVCHGVDNLEITLSAKRTQLTVSTEGKSKGPKKIIETHNTKSSVSFASKEGALTLSNAGDTFIFDGDNDEDAFTVVCK